MINTYSRGFFLGPGLPLGFGIPSVAMGVLLLEPGAGPFRFFVDSVGFEGSCGGAGVEFDSDAASVDCSILSVGSSVVATAGDGASDVGDSDSCTAGFSTNRLRMSEGNLRMTTLDCFFVLSVLGAVIDGDLVSVCVFDIMVVVLMR